jgi:hypothetical protein
MPGFLEALRRQTHATRRGVKEYPTSTSEGTYVYFR